MLGFEVVGVIVSVAGSASPTTSFLLFLSLGGLLLTRATDFTAFVTAAVALDTTDSGTLRLFSCSLVADEFLRGSAAAAGDFDYLLTVWTGTVVTFLGTEVAAGEGLVAGFFAMGDGILAAFAWLRG